MKMRPFKREIREKKGIALIMALWIMTILLVVAASFAFMMRTEVKMAGNYRNGVKAHYLALAGVDHAIAALLNDTGNTDHYGEGWHTTFRTNWVQADVTWDALPIPYGGGTYAVHLSDENSKLSLNYANAIGTLHLVDTLGTGTVNFDKKVCNIFDYRDGAQSYSTFFLRWSNSEMDYDAQSGSEGTWCKNNFFDTIYEIQKVTGINLGASGVYDNPLDENSGRGSKLDMTVYSQDYNTQVGGSDRIDINNTTQALLQAAIGSHLSDSAADCAGILDDVPYSVYSYPLYNSPVGSEPPVGMGVGAVAWVTTENQYSISETEMRDIADKIKVGTDSIVGGTVNINTGTIYGLRGLFNIFETKATAIITYRNGNPFAHRGLIMDVTGIKREIMQQCGDLVTVRSDRFRIYSTGRVTDAGGNTVAARKIEAVVDRHYHDTSPPNAGPIEILYWSERVFED